MNDEPPVRRRPNGLLLYGMYDIRGLDTAPKVRIAMMARALERHVALEQIVGGRTARGVEAARWLLTGRWRRVGAVYVESSTSTPTPIDLAFFALLRLLGLPIGVYFRDAYQLFRDTYPRTRRRQVVMDVAWRVLMPVMRWLASRRFAPTEALAQVLGLRDAILLPPGTDPDAPNLGVGSAPLVAYVGNTTWAGGLDLLLDAMAIVCRQVPDARLRIVSNPLPAPRLAALPAWVEARQSDRTGLPDLLRDARLVVLPLRITDYYSNMAVPVRLMDYLSYGKPIVATAMNQTKALIEASRAGIVTEDSADALATGILTLLRDDEMARRFSSNAHAYASSPNVSWDSRALTVIHELGLAIEP